MRTTFFGCLKLLPPGRRVIIFHNLPLDSGKENIVVSNGKEEPFKILHVLYGKHENINLKKL